MSQYVDIKILYVLNNTWNDIMQFFHLHNIFNWRGRWFFNWRGRWPLPNLGCWLLASLLLVSEVVHLVAFAFSTCSWNTSFSKFILIFWVFCHAWNNPFCYLVRGYDTCLSKENLKAYLRGWCNKTQPQVQYQIPSNTTLAGWQGSGPWSRQALRHFSQISRSLSLPLIWFVSLSPAASLTDAAAFWSTQTCPLQGETLKWPLKLHCNHTQLKTTRKCLPYASQPSVSVLVSWRWIIGKSGRAVPGQTSWVAVTLIAHVCDQICQSHSAVCLPRCLTSVWCSAGLREDQALPELALPFSPCNRSSANTSNTARPHLSSAVN